MSQRVALLIAVGVTAFVLVVVGGVAVRWQSRATTAAAEAVTTPTPDTTVSPVKAVIAQREATYQASLQQANGRLQQANDQAQQAYERQQALASQVEQAQQQERDLVERLQAAYDQQRALQAQLNQAQKQAAEAQASAQAAAAQAAASQAAQAAAARAAQAQAAPAAAMPAPPAHKITPAMAAGIAGSVAPGATLAGEPDLVSFQGVPAYEVSFDRGLVYVNADTGQVLYNGAAAVVVNTAPPSPADQQAQASSQGKEHSEKHSDGGKKHESEHDD